MLTRPILPGRVSMAPDATGTRWAGMRQFIEINLPCSAVRTLSGLDVGTGLTPGRALRFALG